MDSVLGNTLAQVPDILIVDDTPANLTVLSTMLTQQGYKVRPAITGELALRAAKKAPPDLILLDIRMPNMDGYQVCAHFKANERTARIPVIFISALDDVSDKVRGFQVGGVDYITKPFHLEEVLARVDNQLQIVQQRSRIESLSALKDELIRIVSHDLKNPISVIKGSAQLLLKGAELFTDPEQYKRFLEGISRNADYMESLVNDLLDLARIEDGIPLHCQPTLLASIFEQPLANFGPQASQKQLSLIPPDPLPDLLINVDLFRMEQVLNNLLSNALKYTPPGGKIALKVQANGSQIQIHVVDTGLGIPKQDLPHIFDKFYRVDSEQHRAEKGTGLGLYIVKAIVERHGGSIWAESELGKGTTLSIALRLAS